LVVAVCVLLVGAVQSQQYQYVRGNPSQFQRPGQRFQLPPGWETPSRKFNTVLEWRRLTWFLFVVDEDDFFDFDRQGGGMPRQQRTVYQPQRPLTLAERLSRAEQLPSSAYQQKLVRSKPQPPPTQRAVPQASKRRVSYSKLAHIAFLFSGVCFFGAVVLGALRTFCAHRLDGDMGMEMTGGVVMGIPVDFTGGFGGASEPLIAI
jgi:hypothetical protein